MFKVLVFVAALIMSVNAGLQSDLTGWWECFSVTFNGEQKFADSANFGCKFDLNKKSMATVFNQGERYGTEKSFWCISEDSVLTIYYYTDKNDTVAIVNSKIQIVATSHKFVMTFIITNEKETIFVSMIKDIKN